MRQLKVALCQMVCGEDLESNFLQLKELFVQASSQADWLFFPENCLFQREKSSSPMQSLGLDHPFLGELSRLAQQQQTDIFLGSIPLREEVTAQQQRPSNASLRVHRSGQVEVVYRKIHLFDVDVEGAPSQRESEQFCPGQGPQLMDCSGWRAGLSICYDLRFAELYAHYAREGVDLLTVPSSFLKPTGRAHWHCLLRARAIESQCYVLAPAQAGPRRYGHSLVVDPWGEIVAEAKTAEPEVLFAELNADRIERVREQIPMAQHRKGITLQWT